MSTGDPRVGDVGTLYKAEIQDNGSAFDPSAATVKKLIFKTPSGVIEKDATITTEGTGADQKWYLTYTVVAADIILGIHKSAGTYKWQGYVEFADGQKYHTTIGQFTVAKNLN